MRPARILEPGQVRSEQVGSDQAWPDQAWEIEAVLAWHDDNAKAAIRSLLDDCKHLRQQLALAESVMSRGMARGWAPRYERDAL
ncbi:hypothetical protein [Rhizobium leguminosarum]|jgi:hypothetical protein|uniref:Uncharacterized protein n=1 Tax=Rhizobium leguminosarum bv. trifolii (strain WSM1325) TaxID=395491 RepID=C6AXK0_RHILS|nr:hypothetical protein [Rhizobium leguminosarum]ACS56141.1 conserved hypothetical protein [Rhizobium leguminosarum bv. trifolii WSM1325]MBY2918367.1 hypothetical protein [Rhizobium leguminosarum]MBY2936533.1 hypothetical protein [Rhizobium leguminosarum]MBY2973854.1 hypothetical protein [Rhizobium leguminosarum]MBY2981254.1 hypothetical protein [Rhizobium leguminosarum]